MAGPEIIKKPMVAKSRSRLRRRVKANASLEKITELPINHSCQINEQITLRPRFSGHLLKLGSNSNWQRRLFRFDGETIACYRTQTSQETSSPTTLKIITALGKHEVGEETSNYKTLIPKWTTSTKDIVDIRIIDNNSYKFPHCFVITLTNNDNHILRASSSMDLDRWLFVLLPSINVKRKNSIVTPPEGDYEGVLMAWDQAKVETVVTNTSSTVTTPSGDPSENIDLLSRVMDCVPEDASFRIGNCQYKRPSFQPALDEPWEEIEPVDESKNTKLIEKGKKRPPLINRPPYKKESSNSSPLLSPCEMNKENICEEDNHKLTIQSQRSSQDESTHKFTVRRQPPERISDRILQNASQRRLSAPNNQTKSSPLKTQSTEKLPIKKPTRQAVTSQPVPAHPSRAPLPPGHRSFLEQIEANNQQREFIREMNRKLPIMAQSHTHRQSKRHPAASSPNLQHIVKPQLSHLNQLLIPTSHHLSHGRSSSYDPKAIPSSRIQLDPRTASSQSHLPLLPSYSSPAPGFHRSHPSYPPPHLQSTWNSTSKPSHHYS